MLCLLTAVACALSALGANVSQAATSQDTSTVVNLGYASYQGVYNESNSVTTFLGIRYAASPTGNLRWNKPQRPSRSSGIQKADKWGAVCHYSNLGASSKSPFRDDEISVPDNGTVSGVLPASEDCLFLNVWTPTKVNTKEKLPVLFWIHGGGYQIGDAVGYNGTDQISTAKGGVVVVTISYRLGLFGFLSGKEVKKDGSLNAGLLDQQFALQWVQEHIAKFGGDPTRVTIWGQSAGAGSVFSQVIANGGKTSPSLFRGAITSSTFLPSTYAYGDKIPQSLYDKVVELANCSSTASTLNCLRQTDVAVLQDINLRTSLSAFFGSFVWVPVVDGTFIQQRPTEAFRQKKFNTKSLLATTTANEGAVFIDQTLPEDVDVANYVAQLFPKFGEKEIQAAVDQYKGRGSGKTQVTEIMAESIFVCPSYFLLNGLGGNGYKGEYAIPPARHGEDSNYIWPSFTAFFLPPPTYVNAVFQQAYAQPFVDFTISQDPNKKVNESSITPQWPLWKGETEVLFNHTEAGEPDVRVIQTDFGLLSRCKFWESVGALSGQ